VDGIPAELFEASGKEIIMELNSLISKVWTLEEMLDD
jgi:hypothetical protein